MGKPIGIGIVGLGRIAGAHMAAAAELPEDVELVAVSTRNPHKPEAKALEPKVTVYDSQEALCRDKRVEAVVICTPNHVRSEPVATAAAAGKHILVEKPMALSESEAASMVSRCDEAGVQFMVAQSRRFSRAIHKVRELIGELGSLIRVDIDFLVRFPQPATVWWARSQEAGELVLHLQGSHSLDTVGWLIDGMPESLCCQGHPTNPVFAGLDEANIVLKYATGMLASVALSLNTEPARHELHVVGTNGSLTMIERPGKERFSFEFDVKRDAETVFEERGPSVYVNQLREFVESIRENRNPIASGREVLKSARLLDAAVKSYRSGAVYAL